MKIEIQDAKVKQGASNVKEREDKLGKMIEELELRKLHLKDQELNPSKYKRIPFNSPNGGWEYDPNEWDTRPF